MSAAFLAELESLATALVQRHGAARAAVVSEHGEVVAVATGGSVAAGNDNAEARDGAPAERVERVAYLEIARVDEQPWLYADLGSLRLVARWTDPARCESALAWLATQLRRLGVTVEADAPAQE